MLDFFMTPSSQELEPPEKPGRFTFFQSVRITGLRGCNYLFIAFAFAMSGKAKAEEPVTLENVKALTWTCEQLGGYKDPSGICIYGGGIVGILGGTAGSTLNLTSPSLGTNVGGTNARTKDPTNCDDGQVGNPILRATGNKIEMERDFGSSGEMPLALTRTYNHYWKGAGIFGRYWVSSFDYALTFGTTELFGPLGRVNQCFARPGGGTCGVSTLTVIYAWRPDGRTIKFIKQSDGTFYEDKPEPVAKIVPQSDGRLILYSEEHQVETYRSTGHISEVKNEQGIGWTYSYVDSTYPYRITHTSGRYVEFGWNNGVLSTVRDPAGNIYNYEFSAELYGPTLHRLQSVTYPGSPATKIAYHYENSDSTALTGKSYNGNRYSKFAYDSQGRAISSEHNGLDKYALSYTSSDTGLSVVETNPLGKVATFAYQNGKLMSVEGQESAHCPYSASLLQYDSNGYLAMRQDASGNFTAYSYNAKGQIVSQVEGYGSSQARTT